MRGLALIFALTCFEHFALAATTNEFAVIGDWSAATNGLRGRLLLAVKDTRVKGLKEGIVHIELQNVAPGDNVHVYYNAARSHLQLRFHLRDKAGSELKETMGAPPSGFPSPCWLVLPHDASIHFPTGGSSISPNRPGLDVLAGSLNGRWFFQGLVTNDYYLSGVFTSAMPQDDTRPRMWEGTLKLPPIKIPRDQP